MLSFALSPVFELIFEVSKAGQKDQSNCFSIKTASILSVLISNLIQTWPWFNLSKNDLIIKTL